MKKIALFSVSLILGITSGYVYALKFKSDGSGRVTSVLSLSNFHDPVSQVSLDFPSEIFQQKPLTDADRKDQFIVRLSSSEPAGLVTVRREDGLKLPVALSKIPQLDLLSQSLSKAYPSRYPGYKLVSDRSSVIAERDAKEVVFNYNSPSGELVRQKLLIISFSPDTVIYLTMQSTESSYHILDNEFESIIKSFQFR